MHAVQAQRITAPHQAHVSSHVAAVVAVVAVVAMVEIHPVCVETFIFQDDSIALATQATGIARHRSLVTLSHPPCPAFGPGLSSALLTHCQCRPSTCISCLQEKTPESAPRYDATLALKTI